MNFNKAVKIGLIIIFGIMLIFAILMFANGSLEMNPTSEQEEKVKIAACLMGVISIATELMLVLSFKKK